MVFPHRSVAGVATDVFSSPVPSKDNWLTSRPFAPAAPRAVVTTTLTRRYEIAWLDQSGNIEMASRTAPAIAEFEEAFSAFSRGTVIATTEGPVAIEDLVPGMQVITAEGRTETVTWLGAMTLFPSRAARQTETTNMTRITADAFGMGRPMPDLLLGPHARILLRDPRCRAIVGSATAYAPARKFIDGISIVEVRPVAPVTVHHLVLERQGSVRAAGMEVESYHPGMAVRDRMDPLLAEQLLGLFPHMRSLSEFGQIAHPRMSALDVEAALDR